MLSVLIPATNENYLQQTIDDILHNAEGEIEIIVVLDGYWPSPMLKNDKRVIVIHHGASKGMRPSINAAAAIAKGEYLLKCDAHCTFDKGFDVILTAEVEDNWVVVPRRFRLDVERWDVIDDGRPPIDYMYLSSDLHGKIWDRPDLKDRKIDDLMSAQGSCWVMKKSYFEYLQLLDAETYGSFFNEFQEIGLKCWLSGGAVKINKKTWYAHWHKSEGRGYSMGKSLKAQGEAGVKMWIDGDGWHKQIHPLAWLVEKFSPVPGWENV